MVGTAPDISKLRDIHPPAPVSWWPPAPGWWVLLALMLAAVLAAWYWQRRRRRSSAYEAALRELDALQRQLEDGARSREVVAELSMLMRRYALACHPRQRVAGLTGEAWLRFLEAGGGEGTFLRGPGRQLCRAPYAAEDPPEAAELLGLARRWVVRGVEGQPQ